MGKPIGRAAASRPFWRRTPGRLAIGFIVVVVAGLGTWGVLHYNHQRAVAADRARFEQTDKNLVSIADKIRSSTHPENESYQKECHYTYREFGSGPLSCQIYYTATYSVDQIAFANDKSTRFDDVLLATGSHLSLIKPTISPITSGATKEGEFGALRQGDLSETRGALYMESLSKISCGVTHTIFSSSAPPSSMKKWATNATYSLVSTISCSKGAKAPYYEIKY